MTPEERHAAPGDANAELKSPKPQAIISCRCCRSARSAHLQDHIAHRPALLDALVRLRNGGERQFAVQLMLQPAVLEQAGHAGQRKPALGRIKVVDDEKTHADIFRSAGKNGTTTCACPLP